MGAGCGATADGADQDGQRLAVGAKGAVGRAVLYSSSFAAADADLGVRRIGDQAIRTQRSSLSIAGGGLAVGAAAYAFFDAGLGDAVAADPLPIQRLVEAYDSVTEGAGRPDDPRDVGVMKHIDQPDDRGSGGKVPVAGQQGGGGFQSPGQFLLVGGSGHRPADRVGDEAGVHVRIQVADHTVNNGEGIATVGVRALRASRLAGPVPGGDATVLPASGAIDIDGSADSAIPVLAAALERAQMFAALGADRRRDHLGPGLAQGDEQVTEGPRRWGSAVAQQCWATVQGGGERA